MVSASEGWALGFERGYSLILHYTRAGGWAQVKTPLHVAFKGISMTSPTDGWAVGQQNAFIHYEDGAWC